MQFTMFSKTLSDVAPLPDRHHGSGDTQAFPQVEDKAYHSRWRLIKTLCSISTFTERMPLNYYFSSCSANKEGGAPLHG